MSKYSDLVAKLREIFQLDSPDLDFGIYRIINQRAALINDYLEHSLKEKVAAALAERTAAGTAGERDSLVAHLRDEYGKRAFDDSGRLVLSEARDSEYGRRLDALDKTTDSGADHENAVFSHLLTFFSRYYDNGDFISQRRYKGDTYAIPYAGEEVILHWANKDQYYTKSGENFANYTFTLDDGRKVHFRLVAADTAKDNRKDTGMERRFRLLDPATADSDALCLDEATEVPREPRIPVEEVGEASPELILRFEYAAMPKGTKQAEINKAVLAAILEHAAVKTRWQALARRVPTEANPGRTFLEKHLVTYTQSNKADYFIHKDLKGFLSRELDFYIKTEVMQLDDVQAAETFAGIEKNLRMIQCLRAIALELIAFLAQIENFQKKLWLKKKFVTETNYCITLDRVPETLYPEIAAKEAQWAEWEKLGFLSGGPASVPAGGTPQSELGLGDQTPPEQGTVAYLKACPHLVLDTAFFDPAFKARLINTIPDFDEQCDGLLIHSENFQALRLLQERFREQVKCVFIDPPYNTGSDGFIYKDSYRHSSWLTFMGERVQLSTEFMSQGAGCACNLNDIEDWRMRGLLDTVLGTDSYITTVITKCSTTSSFRTVNLGPVDISDRIILFSKNRSEYRYAPQPVAKSVDLQHFSRFVTNPQDPPDDWRYKTIRLEVLHDMGFTCETTQEGMRSAREKWGDAAQGIVDSAAERFAIDNADRVFETKTLQKPSKWLLELIAESRKSPDHVVVANRDQGDPVVLMGGRQFYFLSRGIAEIDGRKLVTEPASTIWTDIDTNNLKHEGAVDFPGGKKPLKLVERFVRMAQDATGEFVLDYFAGSGTTGHAVINLNREDSVRRKYILVEMGEHFDTVLKPRIQKVIFSKDWKDGKPTAPETGISHCFKYNRLESYEDTLNNIALHAAEGDLFSGQVREDFLLHYLLDIESRGSLLSVESFKKPFDYTLRIAVDSAGACERRPIDLVETFNYLIGLRVKHTDADLARGFVLVEGTLPSGEKTLVLWRDCDKIGYEELDKLCKRLKLNPKDSEYDVVYINGDHNIPAVAQETEAEGGITRQLKLRQLEPEFLQRMFAAEDV